VDVATGAVTDRLPEKKLSGFQIARDGTFVVFQEDATEKTDYDVIGGTMNALRAVDLTGGAPRTIVEAKDLKDVTLRWSDEGRMFAYAKKGEIFVQGVSDAKPRSLTPRPRQGRRRDRRRRQLAEDAATLEQPPQALQPRWIEAAHHEQEGLACGQLVADGEEPGAHARSRQRGQGGQFRGARLGAGRVVDLRRIRRPTRERGVMRLPMGRRRAGRVGTGRDQGHPPLPGLQSRDGATFVLACRTAIVREPLPADKGLQGTCTVSSTSTPRWRRRGAAVRIWWRIARGRQELYGVLRYPVNYAKGQKYPTVFELYETYFDNGFNARATFLANHGYAVFHPW
jgi:hypothetical protein